MLELASLNSAFETGMKSPLDDAILAHQQLDAGAWHKIDEVPFDFERRRVSVLLDDGNSRLLVVKGAPEDDPGALAPSISVLMERSRRPRRRRHGSNCSSGSRHGARRAIACLAIAVTARCQAHAIAASDDDTI